MLSVTPYRPCVDFHPVFVAMNPFGLKVTVHFGNGLAPHCVGVESKVPASWETVRVAVGVLEGGEGGAEQTWRTSLFVAWGGVPVVVGTNTYETIVW